MRQSTTPWICVSIAALSGAALFSNNIYFEVIGMVVLLCISYYLSSINNEKERRFKNLNTQLELANARIKEIEGVNGELIDQIRANINDQNTHTETESGSGIEPFN